MTIPKIDRPSLSTAVGGGESTHFNPVCAEIIDRIVEPVLGIEVADVQREVPCSGRRLDLLATADTRRVAIELQYGTADPSHLGRLAFWYAPHIKATDMILVAEDFPEVVVDAVTEGRVPGIALLKVVTGWNQDGSTGLDFEVVASSVTPVETLSGEGDEKKAARERSITLLGEALATHGMCDSNALGHVRLYPRRDNCWANLYVRSGRVVINVGSSAVIDAEAAASTLDQDWVDHGNGLYLTVSDLVDSYAITRADAIAVADKIAAMSEDVQAAITAAAATIRPDEDLELEED